MAPAQQGHHPDQQDSISMSAERCWEFTWRQHEQGGERGQEKDGGSDTNAQNHDNRRCYVHVYPSGVEISENRWITG